MEVTQAQDQIQNGRIFDGLSNWYAKSLLKSDQFIDSIKRLEKKFSGRDEILAGEIRGLKKDSPDLFKFSSKQMDWLNKAMRALEASVMPIDMLAQINAEKHQQAVIIAKEIELERDDSIVAIILYGSVARKEAVKDSDVDLAVVVKKSSIDDKDWVKAVESLTDHICKKLDDKNLGINIYSDHNYADDQGGVHLRVVREDTLNNNEPTGLGLLTPADGEVLWKIDDFEIKDI